MSEVMLVNPRKRRRKMTAKQAKYFGSRRKHTTRRRRRSTTAVGFANPVRRRRRRRVHVKARRNPSARRVLRVAGRRNPRRRAAVGGAALSLRSITSGAAIKDIAIPAAIGGAGALALDVVYGFLPIPAQFKTGTFAPVVKAAAVLGVGALAARVLPQKMVKAAVFSSLTIMAYNFAKATLQRAMPSVPLGAYINGMGYTGHALQYDTLSGVGAYVSGAMDGYGDNAVAWSNMDADVGDLVS